MNTEALLQRLRAQLTPKKAVQKDVRTRLMRHIQEPACIAEVQKLLSPSKAKKQAIWQRVQQSVAPASQEVLDALSGTLNASAGVHASLKQRILAHLEPQHGTIWGSVMKWTASFAVVALLVQMSPAIFLVQPSVAQSDVLLLPQDGQVAISVQDMWEDVQDQLIVQNGMRIRTYDGGTATIVLRDDAVVRLDEGTIIQIHDTSERVDRAVEPVPTLSLLAGRIWVQGLVSETVRGITVSASFGHTTVHDGSMSIESTEEMTAIKVWNRYANVAKADEAVFLVAGQQTQLRQDNPILIKKIPEVQYTEAWASSNLSRDAVHRRYIAHLQHERRAAVAGILPTSKMYAAKRFAEEVDVFMTLGEEARVQKRIDQANRRLNEAAALIAEGEDAEAIAEPLQEFRGALVALGETDDSVSQFLLRQSVSEAFSDVVAAQPGDESYIIKEAVLQAGADLPDTVVDETQIQEIMIADHLASLMNALSADNPATFEEHWAMLKPETIALQREDSPLDMEVRREAQIVLGQIALMLQEDEYSTLGVKDAVIEDLTAFLPPEEVSAPILLTEEQVNLVIADIVDRVYTYKMPQSRQNQLRIEITALEGHEEEGRFLRALKRSLPERSRLTNMVRRRAVELRWARAAEGTIVIGDAVSENL